MNLKTFFAIGLLLWQFNTIAFAQSPVKDDGLITVNLLQLNDVYEIAGLDGGKIGGMARVATVRKNLLSQNKNTCTVMAGDFLSPSAIMTVAYGKSKISGKQMVEAMNAVGVDLVTFGNHEFDLNEADLNERINESQFNWVASNVWHTTSTGKIPFTKLNHHSIDTIEKTRILFFKDADGTELRIGVFAITINSTVKPYVAYDDYYQAARNAITDLQNKCDFIIAVTHLPIDDDKILASQFPEVKLIIGGHEHVNSYNTIGTTIISKADANARTVYIHTVTYNRNNHDVNIKSILDTVDTRIAEDSSTLQVVNKWLHIADSSLRASGFIPGEVIAYTTVPYNGHEADIRFRSTNLTDMIAKAFSAAAPGTACSMFNSGSIRLDDELTDSITQYDVIRTLPYPGEIVIAQMKGSQIKQALDTSLKHPGNGCFLQYNNISRNKKSVWLIGGKKIDSEKTYRVATNDFLVSGKQEYLEFLNPATLQNIDRPGSADVLRKDLRMAVINYLKHVGK